MDVYTNNLHVEDFLTLPSDDSSIYTDKSIHHHSSNPSSAATTFSTNQDFTDSLYIPSDDVAELEWLSSYMDDSYTDFPVNSLTAAGNFYLQNDAVFHPRGKRSRVSYSTPGSEIQTFNNRLNNVNNGENFVNQEVVARRCTHCASEKTPQWRAGPYGPKTLCNACGVRYKSGRLVPEYRPAASPTFVLTQHSNSHRKVMELRRQKEVLLHHQYHLQ